MTIDEAIILLKFNNKHIADLKNDDLQQLAEWLEDYKRLKSIPEHNYDNCHNATCKRKSKKDGYKQGVDDFYRRIKKYMETTEQATYIDEINNGNDNYSAMTIYDYADELAEQIKAGITND